MRRMFTICGFIGLSVLPAGSAQPLTLAVSPAHSFAPATMRIRARLEPNADNRVLTIVADGPDFYRRSDVPLEGEDSPRTFELWFKDVPAGNYEVSAILTTNSDRPRVAARSSVNVLSMFGH
jgi:hypothetical protein